MTPRGPGVLVVVGGMGPAGAERQARLLLEGLPARGFRPHLACYRGPEEVFAALRAAGVGVHLLPRPRAKVWPLALLRFLDRLVGAERLDLVHAFLPAQAALVPCLRIRRPRLRIVTGRRNLDEAISARELRWQRATARLAHAVVANAHAVAASVEAHEPALRGRVRVIPNGLPRLEPVSAAERAAGRARWGLREEDEVIAYLAHFRRGKGHLHLASAAAQIAPRFPRARFLLAGDEESHAGYRAHSAAFRREIDRLGLRDRFLFAGLVPSGREVLAAADLCLNLSDQEGMSNTIMEAMALGLPVVATAVGGTPDLVEDGETGYLVAAGDGAGAAERTALLLEDAERRARMGASGRRRMEERFSVDGMVDAYAALYRSLLGTAPDPAGREAETDGGAA